MATRAKVDQFFELPFFHSLFDQMVKPMADAMGEVISSGNDLDPAQFSQITAEAHRFIHAGMMELVKDHYAEALADEDLAFLHEVYQSPVFLRLQVGFQEMMPKMVAWLQANEGPISERIERALEQVA